MFNFPKRNNNKTRNSQLIKDFQETLINVDEYLSENESIYSIVSVEVAEKTDQMIQTQIMKH